MIGFDESLDTIDFDALVTIAKSRLPALAPQWTDYNIHDPGIMLVELLAWVADSQVYALARNRQDERLAMARLLGTRPRGVRPARGILLPLTPPQGVTRVAAGTRLVPAAGTAPRLETMAAITVLPVAIASLRAQGPGFSIDLTAANRQPRASFAAFGPGVTEGAELRIRLDTVPGVTLPANDPLLLSIGFVVEGGDGGRGSDALGRIETLDGASGAAIACVLDTSRSLQRSGVMIFALPPAGARNTVEIVLRPRRPSALMPRLLSVTPNALPVAQQARVVPEAVYGTGRPGQRIAIVPATLFDSDEAVEGRVWRLTDGGNGRSIDVQVVTGATRRDWRAGAIDDAAPQDQVYAHDERGDGSRIAIRFGNGVNGLVPGLRDRIETALTLSCGVAGNVEGRLEWVLSGHGTRWENRGAIAGGRDAEDADAALAMARRTLAARRALATRDDVIDAVNALPAAFGIVRAEIEDGWERGRRAPVIAATRTLVVARADRDGETLAWHRAILQALRQRVPLGERLLVVSPVYRSFGLRGEIRLAAGRDGDAVMAAIRQAIADRLDSTGMKRPVWPMGRDLDATAIGGWIRRVEGVAAVRALTLTDADGVALATDRLAVGRGELPRLDGPVDLRRVAQ